MKQDYICPILSKKCLKTVCEWYDPSRRQCIVVSLFYKLDEVQSEIQDSIDRQGGIRPAPIKKDE